MSFVADLSALVEASSDERLRCPSEWKRAPLGSVAHVVNGFPFSSAAFGGTGAPVIRIRDVARGSTDTRYAGPVPDGYWIERGDLLIGMDGDFTSAFWRSDRALLNQRVCKVIPNPDALDSRYLAYILPAYLQLINYNTPSVTVKHLSSRTLASIPIPLPDIAVQHRIADRIDELFTEVDDGEAALERARGDLVTWRKALLKAAVTGELTAEWRAANPPTETGADLLARILAERRTRWLADPRNKGKRYVEPSAPEAYERKPLSAGWAWANLGQLSTIGTGSTPSRSNPLLWGGSTAWLKSGCVNEDLVTTTEEFVSELGVREARLKTFPPGTLIVALYGEGKTRGKCAILDISATVNQALGAVQVHPGLSVAWIKAVMDSDYEKNRLVSAGGVQPNLNLVKLAALNIPVPPLNEQTTILACLAEYLDQCEEEFTALSAMSETVTTLRQSILAAAFRGDLVQ